jgi:hypothetical protein
MKAVCWLVVLAAGAAAVYWLGYVVYSLAAMSWEDRFMALLGFAIFGGMIALTAWNERALIRKAEAERERRAAQLPPPLPEGKP